MSALTACASCNTTEKLKQCSRCKTVVYCSPACQRAHWQTHKPSCHFKVVSLPSNQATSNDALSALRTMSDPVTQQKRKDVSAVAQQTFNIPELRLAIFSLLPARDLLRVQQVCRSWYLTIASERKLQQRMFFTAGPGELIIPARKGGKTPPALHPYNSSQRGALAMEQDLEARHGGTIRYLLPTVNGASEELPATSVQQTGTPIIMNPFLTRLWPQHPENMTLLPALLASSRPRTDSWRRMQLTSPPVTSLSMSLWYTKSNAQGSQLLPSTDHVPTGVTLGHLADMLAAQPKKLEYHWMMLHGAASWARSADAVVLPKNEDVDVEHSEGYHGVYVNPSNGIAFPGGFGTDWRAPS